MTPSRFAADVVRAALRVALPALAVLLVAAAVLVAPARPASAATATGWIRAGHLSRGTPAADVRLTPFSGGQPRVIDSVSFGTFSSYARVPEGLYTVSLVRAGAPMSSTPMISQNVRVRADSASTVIATGTRGQVRASVLEDDLRPPSAGHAKIRLVSASTTPAKVDAKVVDGPSLADGVTTGASTGYAEVPAQTWRVALSSDSGTDQVVDRVPVRAGGVYTLVAADSGNGGLQLRAVNDSRSSTSASTGRMPSGGVETGGGGLARTHDHPVLLPGVAAALAVALSMVVLRSRRRRVVR